MRLKTSRGAKIGWGVTLALVGWLVVFLMPPVHRVRRPPAGWDPGCGELVSVWRDMGERPGDDEALWVAYGTELIAVMTDEEWDPKRSIRIVRQAGEGESERVGHLAGAFALGAVTVGDRLVLLRYRAPVGEDCVVVDLDRMSEGEILPSPQSGRFIAGAGPMTSSGSLLRLDDGHLLALGYNRGVQGEAAAILELATKTWGVVSLPKAIDKKSVVVRDGTHLVFLQQGKTAGAIEIDLESGLSGPAAEGRYPGYPWSSLTAVASPRRRMQGYYAVSALLRGSTLHAPPLSLSILIRRPATVANVRHLTQPWKSPFTCIYAGRDWVWRSVLSTEEYRQVSQGLTTRPEGDIEERHGMWGMSRPLPPDLLAPVYWTFPVTGRSGIEIIGLDGRSVMVLQQIVAEGGVMGKESGLLRVGVYPPPYDHIEWCGWVPLPRAPLDMEYWKSHCYVLDETRLLLGVQTWTKSDAGSGGHLWWTEVTLPEPVPLDPPGPRWLTNSN